MKIVSPEHFDFLLNPETSSSTLSLHQSTFLQQRYVITVLKYPKYVSKKVIERMKLVILKLISKFDKSHLSVSSMKLILDIFLKQLRNKTNKISDKNLKGMLKKRDFEKFLYYQNTNYFLINIAMSLNKTFRMM